MSGTPHTHSRADEILSKGQSLEGGLGRVAMSQQTDKSDVWTEEFAVVLARIRPAVDQPELCWLHSTITRQKIKYLTKLP